MPIEPAALLEGVMREQSVREGIDEIPMAEQSPVRVLPQPQRAGTSAPWPHWVPPNVVGAFGDQGIHLPYSHQAEAADAVWRGSDVAIATGTGSGKSLAFMLPIATQCVDASRPAPATALYIAPTKALARDQLRRWTELSLGLAVSAYDGDTEQAERRWARSFAQIVVTNPDMLHHAILPNHQAWSRFMRSLTVIVIDEFHSYRGVFGSHMAGVTRRLRRVADHYGAQPAIVGASATVSSPEETMQRLTGRPAMPVVDDGSAQGALTLAVWPTSERDAGLTERSARIMAGLVGQGCQTLAFVRSRRSAEATARLAGQILREQSASRSETALGRGDSCTLARNTSAAPIAPYRAGYLPEERRELEARLRSGELRGVVATGALELGVDIVGVDAVVVAGWPGTRSSFRQRIGRAGRAGQDSLAIFVPDEDPLDRYLAQNPDDIVAEPERVVLNPDNPYVLGAHLCAAASEIPLPDDEATRWFGDGAPDLLTAMGESGWLRRRPQGWFWVRRDRASDLADLRGAGGRAVAVVHAETGQLVAWVDPGAADRTVHKGAVYTHMGVDFDVVDYDPGGLVASVLPAEGPWSTQALTNSSITIVSASKKVSIGRVDLIAGEVVVSSQVTGYLKRRRGTGEIVDNVVLDLPQRHLPTQAVWYCVAEADLEAAGVPLASIPGAAHAAEHAAIALLPLLAQCDRWDIGGLSTPWHPDTGLPTIFVHDGQAGGSGISWSAFDRGREWLQRTQRAVQQCPCNAGCPSCVQSPKCGNGNDPLDKAGAVALLGVALGTRSAD